MEMMGTERVCYVHCNFCNTILATQVRPRSKQLECNNGLQLRNYVGQIFVVFSFVLLGYYLSRTPLPYFYTDEILEYDEREMDEINVSVPYSNLVSCIVTVRCGHCTNLLTVNMMHASPSLPLSFSPLPQLPQKQHIILEEESKKENGTCSKFNKIASAFEKVIEQPRIPPIRPIEKRHRVPSAYNRFIKEEIQRIKAGNPDISHREAFSSAAKNWAHFPHIQFGKQQKKLDHGEGTTHQNINGSFY